MKPGGIQFDVTTQWLTYWRQRQRGQDIKFYPITVELCGNIAPLVQAKLPYLVE